MYFLDKNFKKQKKKKKVPLLALGKNKEYYRKDANSFQANL